MLRGLVDHITIQPSGCGRPQEITLYGRLAAVLTSPIRVLGPVQSFGELVAGERFRRRRTLDAVPMVVAC